jgi:hypothetical protein
MANYTKYEYQGRILGKSRLVQAVVEDYCKDNSSVSIEEFEELFPKSLQGSIGVVSSIEAAEEKYKGKRHYVKSPIRLSNAVVAVCNQWGKDNLPGFIDHVSGMGFKTKELSGSPNENRSEEDCSINDYLSEISDKIMETGILTQYVEHGHLATVSLEKNEVAETGFEIIIEAKIDDRGNNEITEDEWDYVTERTSAYFEQKGFWSELEELGLKEESFEGFDLILGE